MINNGLVYFTTLVVDDLPKYYIEKIRLNSSYSLTETKGENDYTYNVSVRKIKELSKEDIEKDLEKRSTDLHVFNNGLINKVASDIYSAQKAEKIVNDADLMIHLVHSDHTQITVELKITEECYAELEACIDYYAYAYLLSLINTMGLNLQNGIEKGYISC